MAKNNQTRESFHKAKSFSRTPFTWLMYLLLASYCYLQVSPGSVVPFLHTELHLNYTLDSLHLSCLALGTIVAGLCANLLGKRWSRRIIIWSAMSFMFVGVFLLAVGHVVVLTLAGFFCCGLGGSSATVFIQSALADYYGDQRSIAIVEANTACSTAAVLAPLCLSISVLLGIGWRGMLLIPALSVALLAFFWRKVPIISAPPSVVVARSQKVKRHLPSSFWLYLLVLVLVVALEWGVLFWGSGYLINVVGLGRDLATILMSLFFIAEVLGRVMGSVLTRRISAERLLPLFLAISTVGFLLFWLGSIAVLNVAGLFIAGVGIANLFPLAFSSAANQIPHSADTASAYATLGCGIAIFSAPFVLGRVADMVGLRWALSLVALLIVLAAVSMFFARQASVKQSMVSSLATALELEPVKSDWVTASLCE
jgi:predicted MFS family arabinose efflux permease